MKKCIKQVAFLLAMLLICSVLLVSCAVNKRENKETDKNTTSSKLPDFEGVVPAPSDPAPDTATLSLIKLLFERYSLREIDYDAAMEAAIDAFVAATGDRYAAYYTEAEWQEMVLENGGVSYGIGVNVIFDYDGNFIEVLFVNPNTPAEKEGLLPGMKITHIGNGEDRVSINSLVEEKLEEYKDKYTDPEALKTAAAYDAYQYAISQIKGPEGTDAQFAVTDNDGNIVDFSITRGKVETISVRYKVSETDASIGIVTVSEFDRATPRQFKNAMNELISQGVTKFVFDLRNNPGGDLESVSAMLSFFLNEGDLLISTKDIYGNESKRYAEEVIHTGDYADCTVLKSEIGMYRDYEKTVLVNENSASAAELFTANMRDYELAEIVGVKTYGKGSVQSTYLLSAFGSNYSGAIKLTTKLYFPPCGVGYDGGIGIEPDHEAELPEELKSISLYKLTEENDTQLKAAISLLLK